MMLHPETMLELARDRQRDLMADVERYRLFAAARRSRRARTATERVGTAGRDATVPRARPVGNLDPCGPRAAVPAR